MDKSNMTLNGRVSRNLAFLLDDVRLDGARCRVTGRNCADTIRLGDEFTKVMAPGTPERGVRLRTHRIVAYGRALNQLDPGLTAELQLVGDGCESLGRATLVAHSELPLFREVEVIGEGKAALDKHRLRTRPATTADTPFLRHLHHLVYRDVVLLQFGTWNEHDQDSWFDEALSEADFEVVELLGVPIAAVGTSLTAERIFLAEMQVLPEWQNSGIGTALLASQIQRAQALGKTLELRVLRKNSARCLYERHGFIVTGETETHFLMARRS